MKRVIFKSRKKVLKFHIFSTEMTIQRLVYPYSLSFCRNPGIVWLENAKAQIIPNSYVFKAQ